MLKPDEFFHIVIAIIVSAFVLSFLQGSEKFLVYLFYSFLIIFAAVSLKKLAAYYFETDIRHKTWHWQRFWFAPSSYFKIPIPVGILLPVVLSLLSLGYAQWLAFLQFDSKPLKEKSSKRHYGARFSELVERHLAFIATAGIFGSIILAIVASIIGAGDLAKISIYYAFFNMLPISHLDGTKIFFWSWRLWLFVLALLIASWILLVIPFG